MLDGPPIGPIPESEFYDYYHNPCIDVATVANPPTRDRWYSWRLYQQARLLDHMATDKRNLALLPKRTHEIRMCDGMRESFWGLYAIEQPAFIWFLTYATLCNSPGLIFFFLWLFKWGHAADLQNAVVPVTLSMTLTVCFLGWVFGIATGDQKGQ